MSGETNSNAPRNLIRPATTPEAREQQLISLAYDLAEAQLREGTASSQVITHLLKRGTSREALEEKRMEHEIDLMDKKGKALESNQRIEEMFGEAISAFRSYSGTRETEDDHPDSY